MIRPKIWGRGRITAAGQIRDLYLRQTGDGTWEVFYRIGAYRHIVHRDANHRTAANLFGALRDGRIAADTAEVIEIEDARKMITLKLDSATGHRSVTVAGNTYILRPHYSTDGRRRGYSLAIKTPNAAEYIWRHPASLSDAKRDIAEHAGVDLDGEGR